MRDWITPQSHEDNSIINSVLWHHRDKKPKMTDRSFHIGRSMGIGDIKIFASEYSGLLIVAFLRHHIENGDVFPGGNFGARYFHLEFGYSQCHPRKLLLFIKTNGFVYGWINLLGELFIICYWISFEWNRPFSAEDVAPHIWFGDLTKT